MRISVVIATYDRAGLLQRTLDALARQTCPPDQFEIVVADNGSTDETAAVVTRAAHARDAPAIRPLRVDTPGKSHAINAALAHVSGDLVVFTDDDVQPERQWLEAIARAFDETGADFMAGRIVPMWETAPPRWMSPALYGVLAVPDGGDHRLAIDTMTPGVMPIGANMAVRHHVLDTLGGWRTDLGKLRGSLRTGEDHEFFLRMIAAGFRGIYEPSARVHHFVPSERLHRGYFRKWFHQNGRDVAVIERAYPTTDRHPLGIPRYLWREAAADAIKVAAAALRLDRAAMFARSTRLWWFAGFVRATVTGRRRRDEVEAADRAPALVRRPI